MAQVREVYYVDYGADFGISGFARKLLSRTALRLDEPVVTAFAAAAAEDDDDRLGEDVRLLLDSPLPDTVIHAVWLAAVRRCFDPVEEGTGLRTWLRRLSDVCPPQTRELHASEAKALDEVRPVVTEEELRRSVAAEIDQAAAGLERAVAVPDIVPALRQVVNQLNADLGFRLFLRAAKAYSVPVGKDQYDRLLKIGERLAYPTAAVYDDLNVRWPPIDPSRRDFELGRFGLPMLAAVFWQDAWRYEGTVLENIRTITHRDLGDGPGSQAAVLLEDVQRLLGSTLSGNAVTALWRAASGRWNYPDEFDADGRAWLEQVAQVCRERLKDVDPVYTPLVSPARAELAKTVLREVQQVTPVLTDKIASTDAAAVRGVVAALKDVVTAIDPDLGFRLLLQILHACDVPITEAQRTRYMVIGERFGYSEDHIDDRLPGLEDERIDPDTSVRDRCTP
ncbi:hypothetical protein OG828_20545 [Streptomyces sp. NBC_00457]|uniref:hypothetical protein n=1 Tax=Streptomyces sp. NBC_00457 TaxID=2975748 RepID=UPI002E234E5F